MKTEPEVEINMRVLPNLLGSNKKVPHPFTITPTSNPKRKKASNISSNSSIGPPPKKSNNIILVSSEKDPKSIEIGPTSNSKLIILVTAATQEEFYQRKQWTSRTLGISTPTIMKSNTSTQKEIKILRNKRNNFLSGKICMTAAPTWTSIQEKSKRSISANTVTIN